MHVLLVGDKAWQLWSPYRKKIQNIYTKLFLKTKENNNSILYGFHNIFCIYLKIPICVVYYLQYLAKMFASAQTNLALQAKISAGTDL